MDLLDKFCNDEKREYTVSRKCRKVAEQLGSKIPQEQCKDVSTRIYSTTHEKVQSVQHRQSLPPHRYHQPVMLRDPDATMKHHI